MHSTLMFTHLDDLYAPQEQVRFISCESSFLWMKHLLLLWRNSHCLVMIEDFSHGEEPAMSNIKHPKFTDYRSQGLYLSMIKM